MADERMGQCMHDGKFEEIRGVGVENNGVFNATKSEF